MAKITLRPVYQFALFSAICLYFVWMMVQPSWDFSHAPVYAFLFPILLIFGIWGAIVTILMFARERRAYPEKTKRGGASAADMYALIDRMVDDLNADELDYLQRRMDEARSRLAGEDWHGTLDDFLDERESGRRLKR